jgi:AcrR family transcriptional regulator
MTRPSERRRAQAAENTHNAIVDAARELFAARGYATTTIEQVAKLADVSPATVYAVAGGKRGLLRSLVQRWANSPLASEGVRDLPTMDDPYAIIAHLARASREVRERHGDVLRTLLATAASNSEIATELGSSTARYRGTVGLIAQRLGELGVAGERDRMAGVIWFYFGYNGGYFTLVDDNGWTFDEAEGWLVEQCTSALGISAPTS